MFIANLNDNNESPIGKFAGNRFLTGLTALDHVLAS